MDARPAAPPPAAAILLAAGRGSRLSTLTQETHKSLLPVGNRPTLGHIIDACLARGVEDIVVVTGDKRDAIDAFVEAYDSPRLRTVYNARFAEDTNILSMDVGVDALRSPEAGYMVVECDLVIESSGWETILQVPDERASFWATRDVYGPHLTGGALHADDAGRVDGLVYAPDYTPRYQDWQKLLGVLYVGPREVEADRALRKAAARETVAQYYMMPWVRNLEQLPCLARPVDVFAVSFNDLETYEQTCRVFAGLQEQGDGSDSA